MTETEHRAEGAHGHKSVRALLVLLVVYALLPAFGIGLYRNSSGDRFFSLWYLILFLVISFFLIHEFITPLPPKEENPEL